MTTDSFALWSEGSWMTKYCELWKVSACWKMSWCTRKDFSSALFRVWLSLFRYSTQLMMMMVCWIVRNISFGHHTLRQMVSIAVAGLAKGTKPPFKYAVPSGKEPLGSFWNKSHVFWMSQYSALPIYRISTEKQSKIYFNWADIKKNNYSSACCMYITHSQSYETKPQAEKVVTY